MAQAVQQSTTSKKPHQTGLTDLENKFHAAVSMAFIAKDLLENNLGSDRHAINGAKNSYYLGADDIDAMLFAAYEAHTLIKALRDEYLNALPSATTH